MDDATIRAHLNVGRRTLLDILHDQPADRDGVLDAWIVRGARPPGASEDWLPRTVDQLVWQLTNLEWIEDRGGRLSLTRLGRRARELTVRA